MAVEREKAVAPVPIRHPVGSVHREAIARTVNQVLDGKLNAVGSVTLTAGATSTSVTDRRVGVNSRILLTPRTANAAAELGGGTLYVSALGDGTFTITHANAATTDRTFDYVALGP